MYRIRRCDWLSLTNEPSTPPFRLYNCDFFFLSSPFHSPFSSSSHPEHDWFWSQNSKHLTEYFPDYFSGYPEPWRFRKKESPLSIQRLLNSIATDITSRSFSISLSGIQQEDEKTSNTSPSTLTETTKRNQHLLSFRQLPRQTFPQVYFRKSSGDRHHPWEKTINQQKEKKS